MSEPSPNPPDRSWRPALLATLVFALQGISQIAVTPLGEDLDGYSHWANVIFFAREGRFPGLDEPAYPARFEALRDRFSGPDHGSGSRYADWAARDPAEQEAMKREWLSPLQTPDYRQPNHQAQQPPLYYAVLRPVYERAVSWSLDRQRYALAVVSLLLAAAGLPAIFLVLRFHIGAAGAATALLALAWFPNLMPFLGRMTNDTLAFALLAWALAGCVAFPRTYRNNAVTGVLLGLALFAKNYAMLFLPVYMACFAWRGGPGAGRRLDVRHLLLAAALAALALGLQIVLNHAQTGHALRLVNVVDTAGIPLIDKIAGLFQVHPGWFIGGLIRGFFWCGYWSFVSPGYSYYLPGLAQMLVAVLLVFRRVPSPDRLLWNRLWPHYLLLVLFVLGMWWHANLFTLHARLAGLSSHSGNEGWYLNVLIGSVTAVFLALVYDRFGSTRGHRCLRLAVPAMVAWNLAARWTMYGFWTGRVTLEGAGRIAPWRSVLRAMLDPEARADWLSQPGVLHPVAGYAAAPLAAALLLTLGLLFWFRRRAFERR
jgi:hypothetical protein